MEELNIDILLQNSLINKNIDQQLIKDNIIELIKIINDNEKIFNYINIRDK